jgi:hypothetical protein
MKSRRNALSFAGLVLAATLFGSPISRGAYLPVIGGPSYSTGVGGYLNPVIPGPASVTDSGVAIANIDKYNSGGVRLATGGVRFDAQSNVTELNPLVRGADGIHSGKVYAINNAGAAAGYILKYDASKDLDSAIVARWDAGSTTATQLSGVGTNPNGALVKFGINASGTVFGEMNSNGMVWPAGGGSATLLAPTGGSALPSAINDQGTIVGTPNSSGIRWDPGQVQGVDIGGGSPIAINNNGMIIGNESTTSGTRPVRWLPGATSPQMLGMFQTTSNGQGTGQTEDINDSGIVVGRSTRYDSSDNLLGIPAIYWNPDSTVPNELGMLPNYPYAFTNAINNNGTIAGTMYRNAPAGGFQFTAVYWASTTSGPTDLNSLIDPLSGWTLSTASAISDTGWILGTGSYDPDGPGGQAAYTRLFLIQVPEPASLLISFAFLGLLRRPSRA